MRAIRGLLAAIALAAVPATAFADANVNSTVLPWNQAGNTVSVSAGTSGNSAVQLGWVAAQPNNPPPTAAVYNTGSVDAYCSIGGSGVTASATLPTASVAVPAGSRTLMVIPNNTAQFIICATASGSTTLAVASGTGTPTAGGVGSGGGPGTFLFTSASNASLPAAPISLGLITVAPSSSATASLNAAISAANVSGNTAIILTAGTYTATTLTTITANRVFFYCRTGDGTCVLSMSGNNAISWSGVAEGGMIGVGVDNTGANTNASIHVTNSSLMTFSRIVPMSGVAVLMAIDGGSNTISVDGMHCVSAGVANVAEPLFSLGGSAGFFLTNSKCYPAGGRGNAVSGRALISAGNATIDTIHVNGNLLQDWDSVQTTVVNNGQTIQDIFYHDNILDGVNSGWLFTVNSGGMLINVQLNDKWIAALTGPCVSFAGVGDAEIIKLDGLEANSCGTQFVLSTMDPNSGAKFTNFHVAGAMAHGLALASSSNGIDIQGGDHFTIVGDMIGQNLPDVFAGGGQPSTGLVLHEGITDLVLTGNDIEGSSGAYSTTGINTNCQAFNNVGMTIPPAGCSPGKIAWTPTDASGASLTFSSVSASYQTSGNYITASLSFAYPSTANGNNAEIGGLPATVANTPEGAAPGACWVQANVASVILVPNPNATTAFFYNAATDAHITNAQLSSTTVRCNFSFPLS